MQATCYRNTKCAHSRRVLVLQGVQDPGHIGTLIRSASALGWDAVCLDYECADPYGDKALRAARGATLRVRRALALLLRSQCPDGPALLTALHS
jgi:tRNA G18 (ribose-2'-O)-methylase SpoU